MSENMEAYKIWAPDNALWTEWVKPVLFAGYPMYNNSLKASEILWVSEVNYNTMIIVDMPNDKGVREGLGLAKLGYRPIPLYNGVCGPFNKSMLVNVNDIVSSLFKGSEILEGINIRSDAPPAFMLDSRRMEAYGKEPGKYDNRWCVFPQDMPSAEFLISKGINKIIVRSDKIKDDLSHILCRYQEQRIRIYLCDDSELLREITVRKPSQFRSMIYRYKVILGLTRNATGGFGGEVPEPMQRSSGTRYYRYG